MAAAVEFVLPTMWAGGTMLPGFLTTKRSPGLLLVTSSARTRESEQVMNSVCGFWTFAGKSGEQFPVTTEFFAAKLVDGLQ